MARCPLTLDDSTGEIAPRSHTRDEGGPLEAGLQEQASNDPKLLRSRAVVVSVGGKGTTRSCHVRFRETSASEPSMRCRNEKDDVRTGGLLNSRISPRATCLLSGWRPACRWREPETRLGWGTWEPVVPMLREKLKWEDPMRVRVPMRGTGADQLVLVLKSL